MNERDVRSAVRYWVHFGKFGLVRIDSENRKFYLETKEQRAQDLDSIDYDARIEQGWYDNGVAIRLGKTIGGEHYGVAIDFDGMDAVLAWFGSWDNVLSYAKKNRVEWHKDRSRIHLIFYTDKPLQNRDIKISPNNQIETKCEGSLLRVSPSVHEDGNRFTAIDSEQIPIIKSYELQSKIDYISRGYMSDNDKEEYEKYLDNPNTIIGVGGGRHAAILHKVNSYFWKWGGDWLHYTDDQRFERAWEWAERHCKPNYSREEFDRICDDVIKKYRQERDALHEQKRDERCRTDFENTPGCISYDINPGRFIAGTPDNKIAEFTRTNTVDENNQSEIRVNVTQVKTFTACKPIRIIRHNNPLPFLETQDRFTIEFRGSEPSGCFSAKHKTLSEITALLKNGNALTDKGIDYAITAQIKGFEKAGMLETNDSLDYTGFFPCGDEIISNNVNILDEYPDVTDALDYVNELESKWYVGREDLLAHTLLWFIIAPFSFIFKVINAPLLDWIQLHGNPNTGKTTSGLIGLGLDGNENNEDFNLNMKHVDSVARFGDTISNTTFPKIINEIDLIERDDIVNNIITAVDAVKFRKTLDRNRNVEQVPGLAPLFLTGNPRAPTRPEYIKRVKTRYSTTKEIHLPDSQEAVKYKQWLAFNNRRGHTLGQFRNKFAIEHHDIILDTNFTPLEKSTRIWVSIYESVGRKLPAFFSKTLEEHQMQETIEDKKSDISRALQAWIVDKCRSLDPNTGIRFSKDSNEIGERRILDQYTKNTDRLSQLIEKNLISSVTRDDKENVVFHRQIVTDLESDYGVKRFDLPVLGDSIPNAKYGKLDHGYRVVKCSMRDLGEFFGEIECHLAESAK